MELKVLRKLYGSQQVIDIDQIMNVDVDQFYGIEYDEFPARIAEVALWLMDHQMNLRISEAFGLYYARLPLKKSATIFQGNSLRIDWDHVVPKKELSFILGNPPFLGHHYQNKEQKEDMRLIYDQVKGAGVMDYVSAWYIKAAKFIDGTTIEVAFVSTNSISQGEQVGLLWNELLYKFHVKINFAHRTFNWSNEARGKAAVHVIIVGFAQIERRERTIYDYEDIKGEPHEIKAKNINPYLVDAPDAIITNRREPLCGVPRMVWGNKPTDGGNFLFDDVEDRNLFLKQEPLSAKWIRPFLSGRDLLNNSYRYCLWLEGIMPAELQKLPKVLERIKLVKEMRLASKAGSTRKKAETPTLFGQVARPGTDYLAVPEVSSQRRKYIPIAYLPSSVIASNTIQLVPKADIFIFGILTSLMHMVWVKHVCGRLKSDFRYSNSVVYNNYPWPREPSKKNKMAVELRAQQVLDIRKTFPKSSLADLYDPLTMPSKLLKAHRDLDKAVDLCYRPQVFTNETLRLVFLFDLYNYYIN